MRGGTKGLQDPHAPFPYSPEGRLLERASYCNAMSMYIPPAKVAVKNPVASDTDAPIYYKPPATDDFPTGQQMQCETSRVTLTLIDGSPKLVAADRRVGAPDCQPRG
jgi:hypothetical protein